uniref:Truncated nef protein n=1 Tax=Human immunodeficiency virus type 1 TaxID=11676 RepID=A0A219TAK8_HV1|nr:truncated nef protein [Human immunodeficiency virus 1]ANT55202.1 truncated nef protein [Human immunodeficiency virus 1]ANT55207.1 truncated nef protein [Human immunodeficiency virus 1]
MGGIWSKRSMGGMACYKGKNETN